MCRFLITPQHPAVTDMNTPINTFTAAVTVKFGAVTGKIAPA